MRKSAKMLGFPSSPRMALLLAVCATATASALPPNHIFGRQDTCLEGFNQCRNFPQNFCCPTGRTCLSLAAGTTLLCCPSGDSCARIQPISCDITKQDASKDRNSRIKTTALQGILPKCGDSCCPFGYSCSGDNECIMDKDQSIPPPSSSSSSSSPSPSSTSSRSAVPTSPSAPLITSTNIIAPAPTPTTVDSTTGAAEGTTDTETVAPQPAGGAPAAVIAGVTVGAFVAILAAVVIAFILVKRRSKPKSKKGTPSLKLTRSSSSFGNIISNPIVAANATMRSDFNRGPASRESTLPAPLLVTRKPSSSSSSTSSTRGGARSLTANGLRHSSVAYGAPPAYGMPPDMPQAKPEPPRTPPRQTGPPQPDHREPSSVSINVFADPQTLTPQSAAARAAAGRDRRHSGMTTFTQLMDEADLGGVARGQERFVPYRPGSSGRGQGSPARKG